VWSKQGAEAEMSSVRNNRQSRHRSDQTELEGTDGLDGEKVPLILRDDGPPNGTGRQRNEDIVGE
jgi:hypothetical protein